MCGIFGAIHISNIVDTELRGLQHRGPDGYGKWQHGKLPITFMHRRLSILDLSESGKQPMQNAANVITFNGEIYNFIEVRQELQSRGYVFHSESDTEVILIAYKEWGKDCVYKFNGMWAFAIWDEDKQEIFFSRDRFGKKPLFYTINGEALIFASEMKAIFPYLSEVKPAHNFKEITADHFGYEVTEHTLIEGIKRFPVGTNAVYSFRNKKMSFDKYWNTKATLMQLPLKYSDQVEMFRELFYDACKIRMRSDVPIGTALSGGLDSSAVICTLAYLSKQHGEREAKDWQNAFVASFPGTFIDETKYAKQVVDYLGVNANYINIDAKQSLTNFYESMYGFEELYVTSPFPMLQTYAAIRKHGVVVSIDGHGADEMYSGYGRDMLEAFDDAGIHIGQIKNILTAYRNFIPQDGDELQSLKAYWDFMKSIKFGRKNVLKYYLRSITNSNKFSPKQGEIGVFNEKLYSLFHESVLPTLLRNYDRYAMANGVEIRMPFMDHRLVSFSFSLPYTSKIRKGYTKAIIRDALEPIMPKEIVRRTSKIGFNTPIVDWMKQDWREFLLDTIESKEFKECNLIDATEVSRHVLQVINNQSVTYYQGQKAWSELTPFFWEKAVINSKYWLH